MKTPLKLIACAILAAALFVAAVAQAEPEAATQKIFTKLLTATVANDYDGFMSVCDAKMKAALTKQNLEGVSLQIAPHATAGYDTQYFGELKQRGHMVYVWRLRFKDGSDDVLATLVIKDGKCAGFWLH